MLTFLGYTAATAGVLAIPVIIWFLGKLGYKGAKWLISNKPSLPTISTKLLDKNKEDNIFSSLDKSIEKEIKELEHYELYKDKLNRLQELQLKKFQMMLDIDPDEAMEFLEDNDLNAGWRVALWNEKAINNKFKESNKDYVHVRTTYDPRTQMFVFSLYLRLYLYNESNDVYTEAALEEARQVIRDEIDGVKIDYRFENNFGTYSSYHDNSYIYSN